MLPLVFR